MQIRHPTRPLRFFARSAWAAWAAYRARDTRLGREVAIKVLPRHRASTRKCGRAEREATAIAALAHPNIVTIHFIEEPPALISP
jgi:serine/threonine protein kinase